MGANYFKKGSFNRISDRSGFKMKADQTRQEWTNAIVGVDEWEPRNAQEFVRGVPDFQSVENPRPPGADVFLDTQYSVGYLAQIQNGFAILDEQGSAPLQVYGTYSLTGNVI